MRQLAQHPDITGSLPVAAAAAQSPVNPSRGTPSAKNPGSPPARTRTGVVKVVVRICIRIVGWARMAHIGMNQPEAPDDGPNHTDSVRFTQAQRLLTWPGELAFNLATRTRNRHCASTVTLQPPRLPSFRLCESATHWHSGWQHEFAPRRPTT